MSQIVVLAFTNDRSLPKAFTLNETVDIMQLEIVTANMLVTGEHKYSLRNTVRPSIKQIMQLFTLNTADKHCHIGEHNFTTDINLVR